MVAFGSWGSGSCSTSETNVKAGADPLPFLLASVDFVNTATWHELHISTNYCGRYHELWKAHVR